MLTLLCGCFRLSKSTNIFIRVSAFARKIQQIRPLSGSRYPVKNDVVLYHYNRKTYFRLIGLAHLFGSCYCGIMGHFMYTELRAGAFFSVDDKDESGKGLASWKVRASLLSLSVGVGLLFVMLGYVYAARSVDQLILLQGGQSVKFSTYNPIGRWKYFVADLNDISASGSRLGRSALIPIKVKGHRFNYLLHKEGQFWKPAIFDNTVGVKRF